MWKPLVEETLPSKDIRARRALEDMYLDDGGVYISVTSHAGLIASILRGLTPAPFLQCIWLTRSSHRTPQVQAPHRSRPSRACQGPVGH